MPTEAIGEATAVLRRLREAVSAHAAFVVDDLERILAFDTDTSLPPGSLDHLSSTQVARAAQVLSQVDEAEAGITWETGPGQSLYVTRVSNGLALVILFGPDVQLGTVHVAIRGLRGELSTIARAHEAS